MQAASRQLRGGLGRPADRKLTWTAQGRGCHETAAATPLWARPERRCGKVLWSWAASGEEDPDDVLDGAAAGLGEVAVEGGEAGLEVGKVRVGAAAIWVEPAQVGPLTTAALARMEAVVLANDFVSLQGGWRIRNLI